MRQEYPMDRTLLSPKFARFGLMLCLVFIFTASVFGRYIQRHIQGAEALMSIPVGLLVIGLILFLWQSASRQAIAENIYTSRARVVAPAILICLVIEISVTESLIVLPIERVHAVKYMLLAFFAFFSLKPGPRQRSALFSFCLSSLIGIGEETLQRWIPNRFADLRDIALNLVSCGFGVTYAVLASFLLKSATKPQVKGQKGISPG